MLFCEWCGIVYEKIILTYSCSIRNTATDCPAPFEMDYAKGKTNLKICGFFFFNSP